MKQNDALSILVVNDQPLVRMGLKQLLRMEFRELNFAEALPSEVASAELDKRCWHVVFLNMCDHDAPNFQFLREVVTRAPETKWIVLGQYPESVYGVRALELGASGYLPLTAGRSAILSAVLAVIGGKRYFSEATLLASRRVKATRHGARLSIQEHRVLLALTAGKRLSVIAAELNVSVKTVSTYKSRILNKLAARSVADLVRYATDYKFPPSG